MSDQPKKEEEAPPKKLPFMAWVIAFLVAGFLIAGANHLFRGSERKTSDEMSLIGTVPDFSFTTQDGKTLARADMLGKVWVVDFFFTRCPGPCPVMSSRMAEISKELKKAKDVRLVSVSIDPEHDTPEVLSAYASRLNADPNRWIFLTGPKKEIDEFTTKGMLQVLATDPAGIPTHSTRFLVVDREGKIRSARKLDEPELVQKLLIDIGELLREPKTVLLTQPMP
ncbi:MAG: SCO family protein [bacterium]